MIGWVRQAHGTCRGRIGCPIAGGAGDLDAGDFRHWRGVPPGGAGAREMHRPSCWVALSEPRRLAGVGPGSRSLAAARADDERPSPGSLVRPGEGGIPLV